MLRAGAREAVRQMARCGVTTLGAAAPAVVAGAGASASRAEAGPRRGCAAVLERARGFAAGSAPSMGHGHGHGAPSDAETIAVTFHEKDGSETTVRVRRSSRRLKRASCEAAIDRERRRTPSWSCESHVHLFFFLVANLVDGDAREALPRDRSRRGSLVAVATRRLEHPRTRADLF